MKLTKRMLSLILALIMMLSCIAFVGCEDDDDPMNNELTSDELTDELKLEMQWYYIKQTAIPENDYHGERSYADVQIEFFGGIYKGYAVVMIDAIRHQYEIATEEIGGVEFKYFDTNRLVAYKKGEFISLQEAYEQNILSVSDLEKISEKFSAEKDAYYKVCDRYDFPNYTTLHIREEDAASKVEYLHLLMWFPFSEDEDVPESYFNQYLDKYFADTASGTSAITEVTTYMDRGDKVVRIKLRNPIVYENYMARLMEVPGIYMIATGLQDVAFADSDQVNVSSESANNKWGLEDINVENV